MRSPLVSPDSGLRRSRPGFASPDPGARQGLARGATVARPLSQQDSTCRRVSHGSGAERESAEKAEHGFLADRFLVHLRTPPPARGFRMTSLRAVYTLPQPLPNPSKPIAGPPALMPALLNRLSLVISAFGRIPPGTARARMRARHGSRTGCVRPPRRTSLARRSNPVPADRYSGIGAEVKTR